MHKTEILAEIKRILLHIRFPIQAYTLLGFSFALLILEINLNLKVLLAFISWFLLCSGIAVFNSYYDKDKGPVAGLKNPPKVHFSMFIGSMLMKIIGLFISVFVNNIFTTLYLVAFILSILYSHKFFRFKSNGYIAIIFNFIAGSFTFLAVASLSDKMLSSTTIIASVASGLFLASVYIMMQIHQVNEDKSRGDISFTVRYGKSKAITLSIILLLIAVIFSLYLLFSILPIFMSLTIVTYFLIGLFFLIKWKSINTNSLTNYNIMSKVTNYFGYLGNLIFLIFYFLLIATK